MIRRSLSAVLLAMSALSCASPFSSRGAQPNDVVIDESASGTTVHLRQGQRFFVVLKGNPTTGFGWELVQGADPVLAPKGKPEFAREGARPGAGGSYRFPFIAVQPGTGILKLVYRRPFEADTASAGTFEVTVVVGKVY